MCIPGMYFERERKSFFYLYDVEHKPNRYRSKNINMAIYKLS